MTLRFGSLFSGIGGFDLAFERAGMRCAWQVEIDAACQDVLARHWPDVPRFGGVNDVGRRELEPVDLVCGGFPCQDLSVAGRREGLAGERSGLWFEFHRVLAELEPRWVVIENVPGLLSSRRGQDLAVLLRGLVKLGYGVCWRILDAQYDGVPQRRRRVFIVGHLGDGRAAQVLFECQSGAWDPPPSREAGEVASAITRNGPGAGGGADDNAAQGRQLVAAQCHGGNVGPMGTLRRGNGQVTGGVPFIAYGGNNTSGPIDVATTVNAHGSGRYDFESETFLTYAIQHSIIGRKLDAGAQGKGWRDDGTTWTLDSRGDPDVVAFDRTQASVSGDITGPLRACGAQTDGVNDGKADTQCIAFEPGNLRRRCGAEPSEHTVSTLGAEKLGDTFPCVAFNWQSGGDVRLGISSEHTSALHASQTPAVHQSFGVRRLTPVECARLQGFPDDWNDGQSDTQRYRQFGNAVCVPVVEWIARRIVEAEYKGRRS